MRDALTDGSLGLLNARELHNTVAARSAVLPDDTGMDNSTSSLEQLHQIVVRSRPGQLK